MTKRLSIALAGACVFAALGCAHEPWQPPENAHPANPAEVPGVVTPITSLERFRTSEVGLDASPTAQAEIERENDRDDPEAHQHGDHMEGHQ